MGRRGIMIGALAATLTAAASAPAKAEVLDAVYRGTFVCDKLPFAKAKTREAIMVTIAGGAVSYTRAVRLNLAAVEPVGEKGTGTLKNQSISLQGGWSGGNREFKAVYSGTFVRRSARLAGTQSWSDGGKTFTRDCSGAIKRPLKAFLPRGKKTR